MALCAAALLLQGSTLVAALQDAEGLLDFSTQRFESFAGGDPCGGSLRVLPNLVCSFNRYFDSSI
jgi:hypothetical protein